jgi:DNA-binding NarL/FixJ family response regulator
MAHRIYIVEDHPVMRQGYAALIDREMDLTICGEAATVDVARQQIAEVHPDFVILDLSLEGGSGLELIKDLQTRWPDLPILIVSMHDETLYADRALQAGARGYLMKNEAAEKVDEAIRRILNGEIYLSESLSKEILMQFAGRKDTANQSPLAQLSDRELEVFEYLGQGQTTREIAEILVLSPKTIDSYRTRIKDKLAIDSNAELQRRAFLWVERGMVQS